MLLFNIYYLIFDIKYLLFDMKFTIYMNLMHVCFLFLGEITHRIDFERYGICFFDIKHVRYRILDI